MGEVYRAKDQRPGRDVAIKVLPEEFAKNADRVASFEREWQSLADRKPINAKFIRSELREVSLSFMT